MSTTETVTVNIDQIYDSMREAFRKSIESGRNWHAVTVGVDGIPYTREEVSRCESESEYYRKGRPHPVTVWSTIGDSSVSESEIDSVVDAFEPSEQFSGYGGIEELVQKLEAAGFEVEI